jgi:hypothetical protein
MMIAACEIDASVAIKWVMTAPPAMSLSEPRRLTAPG